MIETKNKQPKGRKCDKPAENETAMVVVIKRLTGELTAGRFKGGQPIRETVLAKEYGVSRSAIREALNQIVGWGLFEYIPYRGYQMKEFTADHLIQWNELREAIEPIAARRLAQTRPPEVLKQLKQYNDDMEKAFNNMDRDGMYKADLGFHSCVVEHCGNDNFSHLQTVSNLAVSFYLGKSLMEANHAIVEIAAFRSELRKSDKREDFLKLFYSTLEYHQELYEAIASGDAVKAENGFRIHAHNQVVNMENYVEALKMHKHFFR